jgi:RNA polymerase sigma-70 factor (ECF subfamily)
LNRTYALAKAQSPSIAIKEAEKLKLINNHLYFSLLGELHLDIDPNKALEYFQLALSKVKNDNDRQVIQAKIDKLIC